MSRVGKDVVSFLPFVNHGYLAGRKVLELLLMRGGLRSDDLKAGGYQHAFSVLGAGMCRGAADQQCCADNRDTAEQDTSYWFHRSQSGYWYLLLLIKKVQAKPFPSSIG
jgi:hypothetical protein